MQIAPKNVVSLYSIASITALIGIKDYTDGIYGKDANTPYDVAQKRQHNFLLDEIGARKGFRLLDVGCGLGALLKTAQERGVNGMGITISDDQAQRCRADGLKVSLMNYKDIPSDWHGKFDGIIANGSLEHFCQPEEALAGKQNEVYEKMFKMFFQLLDKKSAHRKVATTAIHFSGQHVDPKRFFKNPFLQLFCNEAFHFAILHRGYGGYYPILNQLKYCAKKFFELEKEVDGTKDYYLTSEHWCQKIKEAFFKNKEFREKTLKYIWRSPKCMFWIILSMMGPESWPWQFRKENPPTRLYRHTWRAK